MSDGEGMYFWQLCVGIQAVSSQSSPASWAIPFNKRTPPMDDFSVSVPGGIDMIGYLRILL